MRALASSLLANAEVRIVYRQEPDQLGSTALALGLTGTEQKLLPTLGTGQGLWHIKDRSFVVQRQATPPNWPSSRQARKRPESSRPGEENEMSDSTQAPRLRVETPSDIVELVPYLLGFAPQESVVILVIQAGVVQVTARADIAELEPAGAAEDVVDRIWHRFPDADAYLLAYTANPQAGWALLDRCADQPAAGHLPARRCSSTTTRGTCPTASTAPPTAPEPSPPKRPTTGLRRLDRRADLEAAFASPPDTTELTAQVTAARHTLPSPGDTAALLARTSELLRRTLRERASPAGSGRADHPPERGRGGPAGCPRSEPKARDLALLSITSDNAARHLQLWRSVVNRVPAHSAAGPLFLAGIAAWVTGDGASASIALDRAQAAGTDLGHGRPVDLLAEVIDRVVPPPTWERCGSPPWHTPTRKYARRSPPAGTPPVAPDATAPPPRPAPGRNLRTASPPTPAWPSGGR